MAKVCIGTYTILPDGTKRDETRDVRFQGELIGHCDRHTETGTAGERLYRTGDGRLILWARVSTKRPSQTIYMLHEVTEEDLIPGGQWAEVGRAAGIGRELTLEEALSEVLDLESALRKSAEATNDTSIDHHDIAGRGGAGHDRTQSEPGR